MPENELSLAALGGGAAVEMFDQELQKALADIKDPNTDLKKPREVVLRVKVYPSDAELKKVEIFVETKLGKLKPFETHLVIGMDGAGKVLASEYQPQQLALPMSTNGKVTPIDERRQSK